MLSAVCAGGMVKGRGRAHLEFLQPLDDFNPPVALRLRLLVKRVVHLINGER